MDDEIRLEEVSFNELKFLDCSEKEDEKKMRKQMKNGEKRYGIKRHKKSQFDKLNRSIKKNGWVFPLIVAELLNKEKYLIDGYARWKIEDKNQNTSGFKLIKHPAIIIQAKDLDHVKELYLQCQSSYGSPSLKAFRALSAEQEHTQYETGLITPNYDLDVMTRDDVARAALESHYQKYQKG